MSTVEELTPASGVDVVSNAEVMTDEGEGRKDHNRCERSQNERVMGMIHALSFPDSRVRKIQYGLSPTNKTEAGAEDLVTHVEVSTGGVVHRETHGYVVEKHRISQKCM